MSKDFYKVCDDKNILLEKNDFSSFRINLSINNNSNNNYNLIEIINQNELWNLLYELNKDIIEEYNYNKLTNENNEQIYIKIKNIKKNEEFNNISLNIENIINKISDYEYQLYCFDINNINNKNKVDDFKINIKIVNNITIIDIDFTFNENTNDAINTYIALYIKKIFYRLSKYLS